ncbi:hypothetical protein FH002_12310 [Listeria monocytogenes]|nr:hypothetical protein [Listeria monocytogenes]
MEEKKVFLEFLFIDSKGDLTPADALVINIESMTNRQQDCEHLEGHEQKLIALSNEETKNSERG